MRWIAAVVAATVLVGGLRVRTKPGGDDPINTMVGRLDLERYKATIKGLTQFGDRRQGTDRNRAAVDWIDAQLRSYGCANVQRLKYIYNQSGAQLPQAAGTP